VAAAVRSTNHSLPCTALHLSGVSYGNGVPPCGGEFKRLGTVEKEAPGQIPPPSGKELMFVEVELFNAGTETLESKPEQFSMKDSSGAEVKTFGKRQAYNALDMSPLEPNYGTTTAFICAVDPGSTGFVFTFTHEVDGQKTPFEVSVR